VFSRDEKAHSIHCRPIGSWTRKDSFLLCWSWLVDFVTYQLTKS
jgi:hypothetical protein